MERALSTQMSSIHIVDRTGGGEVVGCPVTRHDVDVDLCERCPNLRELALDAEIPYVRCEAPPPPYPEYLA